jgi:hypothetical protein
MNHLTFTSQGQVALTPALDGLRLTSSQVS